MSGISKTAAIVNAERTEVVRIFSDHELVCICPAFDRENSLISASSVRRLAEIYIVPYKKKPISSGLFAGPPRLARGLRLQRWESVLFGQNPELSSASFSTRIPLWRCLRTLSPPERPAYRLYYWYSNESERLAWPYRIQCLQIQCSPPFSNWDYINLRLQLINTG